MSIDHVHSFYNNMLPEYKTNNLVMLSSCDIQEWQAWQREDTEELHRRHQQEEEEEKGKFKDYCEIAHT